MPRKPRQASRINAGRRIALATVSSLAAGSLVLSSGYTALAQPTPTPSDTHTTPEPTPSDTHTTEPPPMPPPSPVAPPAPVTPPSPVQPLADPPAPAEGACTHTVVRGDTLSAIALRYLGDANRHPEIYAANQALFEAAAREHPGPPVFGTSNLGHWIYPGTVLTIPGAACPTHPATPALADCSKHTFFFGVRGSGEEAGPNNLGGSVIPALFAALNRPAGSVGVHGVPYGAVDAATFIRDVVREGAVPTTTQFGAILLADAIRTQAEACPDQEIFLGGYSQGALVIRSALPLLTPDVRARISGIALFGDPTRVGPALTSDVEGRTTSQCAEGDPVCDRSAPLVNVTACLTAATRVTGGLVGRFGSTCPHFSYSAGGADLAAAFLRSQIQ